MLGVMGKLAALTALDRALPISLEKIVRVATADHFVTGPSCGSCVGGEIFTMVGVVVVHTHPVPPPGAPRGTSTR